MKLYLKPKETHTLNICQLERSEQLRCLIRTLERNEGETEIVFISLGKMLNKQLKGRLERRLGDVVTKPYTVVLSD